MTNVPLVSICIPTYNPNFRFLHEAIESVRLQTYPNIELLINDDCSDISAHQIYKSLGVKYAKNNKNYGMVKNWNTVVKRARGEYILLLGQDDILAPTIVEACVKEMENVDMPVCVSTGRHFISEKSDVVYPRRYFNDRSKILSIGQKVTLNRRDAVCLSLMYGNVLGEPSCVLYRKNIFDKIGGYRDEYSHMADLDFNLRASSFGSWVFLNKKFVKRRLHNKSLTKKNLLSGAIMQAKENIYNTYKDAYCFSEEEKVYFRVYVLIGALRHMLLYCRRLDKRLIRDSFLTAKRNFSMEIRYLRGLTYYMAKVLVH